MTDTTAALTNLQDAIADAAKAGPFVIDAAFLAAGLNSSDVIVPDDYDTILGTAFQTSADKFSVICDAEAVGGVSDNQFSINSARIAFIDDETSDTPATLVFSTALNASGVWVLNVQINSSPIDWDWTDSFPYMGGWPFNQLVLSASRFVFSSGGGAIQNLQATVAWPALAQPFLALFAGLTSVPASLPFVGALDMSHYGGPDFTLGALLPSGVISALLSNSEYTFAGYLTVSKPSLTLIIPNPSDESSRNLTPTLALTAFLHVEGADNISYQIQVLLFPSSSAVSYSVVLTAAANSKSLSPTAAIALMGNVGSYFDATPLFLQQFLASFDLSGMTLSGTLGSSVSVTQITVQLSTPDGVNANWQPLPAPTPDFSFTVESFYLNWTVYTPFRSPTFSYQFGTTFIILPTVFKSSDGGPGGLFTVEFTSDESFAASFDGSASLSDFLNTVSHNAVILPKSIGVDATVANIVLELDCSSRSFSFYSDIDIDVSFFSVNGNSVLSLTNGGINLSALSATSSSVGTVWSGEFFGLLNIDSLSANCSVSYDGANWVLSASLTESININNLITQFFSLGGSYSFPDFLPGQLILNSLDVLATIPADSKTSYAVSTYFDWSFSFGGQTVEIDDANLAVNYDGSHFSASTSGIWIYKTIGLDLGFAYTFEADGSQILAVSWEGFTATWLSKQNSVSFTLTGWTLGALIQKLVASLGDPYFTLPSPWNLLNQISLNGLVLTVSLEADVSNPITGSYTLSSSLNLGFIIINGLSLTRSPDKGNTKGKVIMVIDGIIPPQLDDVLGDLMDPDKGQDVQKMPSVPGQGSEYFKLFLLALGQRISINGHDSFNSTEAVINALATVPSTDGPNNPVNPANNELGQPYYNAKSNWLIAAHFGLMKTGEVWAVDFQMVFNDPDLYGMRLTLNGGKTGAMSGFMIDILYKKITNDIGLFDIEFTFPDSIRNLNFGAVSVVLPSIGIQI